MEMPSDMRKRDEYEVKMADDELGPDSPKGKKGKKDSDVERGSDKDSDGSTDSDE